MIYTILLVPQPVIAFSGVLLNALFIIAVALKKKHAHNNQHLFDQSSHIIFDVFNVLHNSFDDHDINEIHFYR